MVTNRIAMLAMALAMVPGPAWSHEVRTKNRESDARSLPRANQLALSRNPEPKAVAVSRNIAGGNPPRAGHMPHLFAEVEFKNHAVSGSFASTDAATTTNAPGQIVEIAGKRWKRREIAGIREDPARWNWLDIPEGTSPTYLDGLDAQRTYFEVNIQSIEWLASYRRNKTVLERLTAGKLTGTTQNAEKGND